MKTRTLDLNKINDLLEYINYFNVFMEVKEIKENSAVIYLDSFYFTYEVKTSDWSFIVALEITTDINMEYCLSSDYGEDISVFSAYDLLKLKEAIEKDEKNFNNFYRNYFFLDCKHSTLRDEAFNKDYVIDYIRMINKKYNGIK